MRTIKFRGKDIETGEWLYGHFFQRLGHYPAIVEQRPRNGKVMYFEIAVEDTTVGQFNGLYDKNGKEIYEGDVLSVGGKYNVLCEFKHGAFGYSRFERFNVFAISAKFLVKREFEVIGNIYDNPELLKGGGK